MKRRGNVLSPIDSVNTLVEMLVQTDSSVEDGETVWVRSSLCLWVYRIDSGLVPDGVNVVASLYGTGVWLRLTGAASAAALLQPAWFISATGNDQNSGSSSAAPLQTFTEYRRRVGGGPLLANQTVTLLTNLLASDVLDTMNFDTGIFVLTIIGQPTVVLPNRTISVYANRTPAANTPNLLTDGAAMTWVIAGGNFVRMTSGPALGLCSTAFLDLGANQARVGTFINSSQVETQPVATNTFETISVPTVVQTRLGTSGGITYQFLRFTTNNVRARFLEPTVGVLATALPSFAAMFVYCCFDEPPEITGPGAFIGCQFMRAVSVSGNGSLLNTEGAPFSGCVFLGVPGSATYQVTSQISAFFTGGTTFQGCSLLVSSGLVLLTNVAFFDTVTFAINGLRFANLRLSTVYGNTGAGNPAAVNLDRSSRAGLSGTGQTLTNGGAIEIAMVLTANTTFAAARAAGGVKDGATSDATIMVI